LIGGEYYAFWPVFNIADASISIAIVCILVFQKKLIEKPENEKLEPKVNSDYIQTGESQTTSGNP
jgi:signal peptidase II